MSYDLLAWPVDRTMSDEDAIADIERRVNSWKLGLRRDKRVDAFVRAMDDEFPGITKAELPIPMEFDAHNDRVHMALPWSMVADLLGRIAAIAFTEGLALFDPQRMQVALPAPFGPGPMGTAGIEGHEQLAGQALGAITETALGGGDIDADGLIGAVSERLRASGFTTMSPLGFEITLEVESDVLADPTRVPPALQTPERKAELLRDLEASRSGDRHQALLMLSGWDPDPEVRAALLPYLVSDDVYVAGQAAQALARQGRAEDLPALMETMHRMSPADGGTLESMLGPLGAALSLAYGVGPDAVADVRAKAATWRHAPEGSRSRGPSMSDGDFEQLLDGLAAAAERRAG